MTTDKPAVLTDEEFARFCEAWINGENTSAILRQFGIGKGQWWRVTNAAHRKQNREYWKFACENRRAFRDMMKFDSLYERAMKGTCRTRRTRNGTVQVRSPINPKAMNRLMGFIHYKGWSL